MPRTGNRRERGAALYVTSVSIVIFAAMSVAMVTVALSQKNEREELAKHAQRRYLAESGISDAVADFAAGGDGTIGSADAPVGFGQGSYYVTVTANGDGTSFVDSRATVGSGSRTLRAVARPKVEGVWAHALFAGNGTGDDSYDLELSGRAPNEDTIVGDVYSGGDVVLSGDATVDGIIRSGGTISGDTGQEGVTQPLPDLVAMDYANNNDVDVSTLFSGADAVYTTDPLGGAAWQLPEESPAHIFRKNPSDRILDWSLTPKDDYYLEDPYEVVNSGKSPSSDNATSVSLSTLDERDEGFDGNDLIYYVDGNLWIDNSRLYNITLKHQTKDVRVTFVAKGNIYINDNVLTRNDNNDGVLFIALEDENYPGTTGNVYIGDGGSTPVARIEAFIYAENDIVDTNYPDTGRGPDAVQSTEVIGVLSAGGQFTSSRDSRGQHLPLQITHDPRILDGSLALPGVPENQSVEGLLSRELEILTVFEVGND